MPPQLRLKMWKAEALPQDWFKRARSADTKTTRTIETKVRLIIRKVRKNGDSALVEFTAEFDKIKLDAQKLRVTSEEMQKAYGMVTAEQVSALKLMKDKVGSFEKLILKQLDIATSKDGITIQNMLFPIESVGCYVPGGQAAYPSSVVMTATPAKVAGVPRIVVCSPPGADGTVNPLVLVAADICEVNEIYRIGGAQAIAALAYGTQTIKPVKKIVGPGNKYVTAAKVLASRDVAIDMPAGPSEVLVLADETANPKFVAADMISQAEHGGDSVAGLITTSQQLAEEVANKLKRMATSAERSAIVKKALAEYSFIITCTSVDEMIMLSNVFAPEHLEILTKNPIEIADKINAAGLILIGPYSPVSLSDYGSGTNHVLPTGGFAKTYSALSALDFVRRVSVVESSKEGLLMLKNHVKTLAEAENLPNHYKAVEARFEDEG